MSSLKLASWIAENKFEFLEGDTNTSDETKKILTPAETQKKLLQLMNSEENSDCIKGWVQVCMSNRKNNTCLKNISFDFPYVCLIGVCRYFVLVWSSQAANSSICLVCCFMTINCLITKRYCMLTHSFNLTLSSGSVDLRVYSNFSTLLFSWLFTILLTCLYLVVAA